VGEVTSSDLPRFTNPFNGPVEIGLRALAILNEAYPDAYSLQKLTIFDYLIVHSDDMPDGPSGLHPKTPHRSGELLVRRGALETGLLLYQSRALIERVFTGEGVFYRATERSAAFLDVFDTQYAIDLRERSTWLIRTFGSLPDVELHALVQRHLGEWGAEFELESVLWADEAS
jgi:hypothetical protein